MDHRPIILYPCSSAHTALDVIAEKISQGSKVTPDARDLYLGLLYASEEYKV